MILKSNLIETTATTTTYSGKSLSCDGDPIAK